MAYYYVYIPFSNAHGLAKACYNSNCESNGTPCINQATNACTTCANLEACYQNPSDPCPHCTGITGMTSRSGVDIGGPANSSVRMYVSSNIRSIRTIKTGPNDDGDSLCGAAPPAGFAWVNEGVKVELWCGPSASGTKVGTVFLGHLKNRIANNVYNTPHGRILGYVGDVDCNCSCYHGFHTHMERSGGSTNSWSYDQALSTSFWVYRWSGPDTCAF